MMNLSNIENPDEKIKTLLKQAIKNKEDKINKLNSDIESIKKQDNDGNIFVPLKKEPEFNVTYVGKAITTIIGDILYGFGKGVRLMSEDIDKQRGGNTTDSNNNSNNNSNINSNNNTNNNISKEKIQNNTNELAQVIDKAQNKVNSKSLGDTNKSLNDSYSKATELGETAFKSGLKWTEDFINMLIDVTLDATGQSDVTDISWKELSPELNKKLVLTAGLLKELSENPATREAVKEIAKAIAITMVEIMKEIKPELDKVTEQSLEMLDEVSKKAVSGASQTGLSVAQAFIAEIPFWGGIIDFIIAMGKGFNAVSETYKVFITKSSPIMIDSAKAYVNTEETIERGKNRISNAYDNAMDTLTNASNMNNQVNSGLNSEMNSETTSEMNSETNNDDNITNNTNVMKGGVFIPNKNIKNKILKGGNRLKKTMKLFHKTLPRVKYSYKNNDHKDNHYRKHGNYHKRTKTNKKRKHNTRKHNK